MKIVVFGAGRFYQRRKEELLADTDVCLVAIIDNNREIQGTELDGIPVFAVERIGMLDFDIVLLMSTAAGEMKKQLVESGVDTKKIWYWRRYKSEKEKGTFYFHCGHRAVCSGKKRVLIISTDLGYSGGALAAVYGAKALRQRNYEVVLAAPGGNPVFIKEIKNQGLNIVICPALPYLYEEELALIEQFDVVIVNVFPMLLCASEISKRKPVVWWIHEASNFYEATLLQFDEYAKEEQFEGAEIYGVSRIAQENFNYYFPNRITRTLAYGIPDESGAIACKGGKDRIVFAVIGAVTSRKAQDLFLEAVKNIDGQLKNKALFWIIGLMGQDSYCDRIRDMVSHETSAVHLGEMTREEIQKAFDQIDVLVCPSWEDPLPIVVTEALMYGKACIVSDSIGMADYIVEGQNGFIFPKGNGSALSEKMEWIMGNRDQLCQIGQKARKTYEKHFTLERFGERLEQTLQNVLEKRKDK